MATRLFVGNLPENTEEADLQTAFSCYGDVKNLDLKSKSTAGVESKLFAFVTISGSNYDVESCIKYFSNEDFNGKRLYVTRARESFLERLQRERLEAQQKKAEKAEAEEAPKTSPEINSEVKLNPLKRKTNNDTNQSNQASNQINYSKSFEKQNGQNDDEPEIKKPGKALEMSKKKRNSKAEVQPQETLDNYVSTNYRAQNHSTMSKSMNDKNRNVEIDSKKSINILENKKKQDSDIKRLAAMIKKRQEFLEKQMIVKTGLAGVDKAPNKKITFSDNEDDIPYSANTYEVANPAKKNTLFDDDDEDSGDELNFEIKKQFEGKGGQKVLDLQSRYKSDKRFVLDERFIEDEREEATEKGQETDEEEEVEVNQKDEKIKQLNILQDVLGVPIKRKIPEEETDGKKNKPKLGMLRFDPSQPEHSKFLAPIDDTIEPTKKSKKKKDKQTEIADVQEQKQEEQRPEVSKEQFYKVSDTLKEAIAQPTKFSLRSLFGNVETVEKESKEDNANYLPLEPPKKSKFKNPLEPGEKNPFIYDSSDSETEEAEKETKTETLPVITESKAVWKENFFFGLSDQRFEEGLAFFNSAKETEAQKERRGLKSLMKKRIYNKERKDQMQMFQKKIGGRKKTMKKSFVFKRN